MQQLWMCGQCHSLNDATAKRCYRCSAKRKAAEVVDSSGSPYAPGVAAVPPRDPSLFGALILGVIAAILATALWYWFDAYGANVRFFGWSWFTGVAIGVAVTLGGRARTSFGIVVLSVLLTIASLIAGEYLLLSHEIAVANAVDTNQIVVADPRDVLEALPRAMQQEPVRPVLWVVAIGAAFISPWGRLVGKAPGRRG